LYDLFIDLADVEPLAGHAVIGVYDGLK